MKGITKLFTINIKKHVFYNSRMCTTASSAKNFVDNRLEHYRNLQALEDSNAKPIDWDEALPFEKIPGPKPLPVIGNSWRFFFPKVGEFYGLDFLDIHKNLQKQYGDVTILKGLLGRAPVVFIFDPKDFENLHRNEGIWPIRRGLPSFQHYRSLRKSILSSGGLISLEGEEWFKFRTVVNPILMQPQNILNYADKMNVVGDELIDNIKYFCENNANGQMPDDFQNELYKWSLESIGVITMDTRLGCLKRTNDKNSEGQKLIESVIRMFHLMYKLDVLPSVWKYISTKTWREYVKILDFLFNTNLKYINQHLQQIEKAKTSENEVTSSVLSKMLKIDKNVAIAVSLDMMIAGVDTTGRILAAALYYLSKNPEVQDKYREEVLALLKHKDSPVTKEILAKAFYTKAVIKETTRLSPVAIGNLRTTTKDLVLGGYRVPKGTYVLTSTLLLSRQEEQFHRAKEFLPERWLSTATKELSHKNTNPFVFAPFGFGPRSCVGKRLANLELETALLKIIRNFELNWPHKEITFSTGALHGIAEPLRLHVKILEH